ncbi:MAG: hypothetical protein P9L99_20110 [Candidatus Lernaella stagnicola]|nr:hypothetical protein [Candidatus Lernaella stagnicola]
MTRRRVVILVLLLALSATVAVLATADDDTDEPTACDAVIEDVGYSEYYDRVTIIVSAGDDAEAEYGLGDTFLIRRETYCDDSRDILAGTAILQSEIELTAAKGTLNEETGRYEFLFRHLSPPAGYLSYLLIPQGGDAPCSENGVDNGESSLAACEDEEAGCGC